MEINKIKCLKEIGVQSLDTECVGCPVAQSALSKSVEQGITSREHLNKMAERISNKCCPNGVKMILPKGSKRLVW